MEKRREKDQECGATNNKCSKNSENESNKEEEEEELYNSETESTFHEEGSDEEVQSKETGQPEFESRNYIGEEEQSDEEEEEVVDEEPSEVEEEEDDFVDKELSEEEEAEFIDEIKKEKKQSKSETETSSFEEEDDDEEEEEEEESGEEFQPRETKKMKNEEDIKNFENYNEIVDAGPNPPPPLPLYFKNRIHQRFQGVGISIADEVLVVQKQLSETEVNHEQTCRFHISYGLIKNALFNDDELDELVSNKLIPVKIIDPLLENVSVTLRRRIMKRNVGGGEPLIAYVLDTGWNGIVKGKNLEEGDIVQLWGVRVGGNLCFFLVKLPKEGGDSSGCNSSLTGGGDTLDNEAEAKPSSASTEE